MVNLQDIFNAFSDDYVKKHKSSLQQFKALNSISNCRTSKLGGHANSCDNCGNISIAYNSCRDRHCPMCQSIKREKWRVDRNSDLLNTHYFHIVFTVPDTLNALFYHNQSILYSLLMKSAANTLLQLCREDEHLDAQIGLTGILHTWGQTLSYHPHVHFIVPGGGLCLKTNKFKTTSKKFFIHVNVMSGKFRKLFVKGLEALHSANQIIDGNTAKPISQAYFSRLINSLSKKKFIVFSKANFDSPTHVVKYLCQYTHRVAIANQRIVAMTDDKVTFKYKDYNDNNKVKTMTLKGSEFIRRFLMHVLPNRFVKIRHYGIFAGRNRPTKLAFCQRLMNLIPSKKSKDYSTLEFLSLFMNIDFNVCPACKQKGYKMIPLPTNGTPNTS